MATAANTMKRRIVASMKLILEIADAVLSGGRNASVGEAHDRERWIRANSERVIAEARSLLD